MEAPMASEKTRERAQKMNGGYSTPELAEAESSTGTGVLPAAGRFLAIAVAHDGLASDHNPSDRSNGHKRESFEDLIDVLLQSEAIPATLCFYTEGVRWVTRESPVLSELQEIRRRGAEIVTCRACLTEAGLLDAIAVGRLDTQDHIDDILRHAQHTMVV
jgi:hypothetical protein